MILQTPTGINPFLIGLIITCIIFIAYYIIAILLAIWVFKDANERDMNGHLWIIVVALSGIIGFMVYIIFRR